VDISVLFWFFDSFLVCVQKYLEKTNHMRKHRMKKVKPKRKIFFYEDRKGRVHEIRINVGSVDSMLKCLRQMGCKIGSDSAKVCKLLDAVALKG
jgi:predicted phosphatase